MASPSYVGFLRPLFVALFCLGITAQAHAGDTLVPGAPKPGTVTYTVTLSNGTVVKVPVTITTEKTKGEKAETIATTMQGAPYNLNASVTSSERWLPSSMTTSVTTLRWIQPTLPPIEPTHAHRRSREAAEDRRGH